MLDFVIFAVVFVVALLIAVFYLYPPSRRLTTIPGVDPSDAKEGNLPDIISAGSLHQFLQKLHDAHGPIAGFWFGEQYSISLASPELFKEHLKAFDRPLFVFESFFSLVGNRGVFSNNGMIARQKRKEYDHYFNHTTLKSFVSTFEKVGGEVIKKWDSLPKGQHIPLQQYMMSLVIKSSLATLFGIPLEDEEKILDIFRHYSIVWTDLEARQFGAIPDPDSQQEKNIQASIQKIRHQCLEIIENRMKSGSFDPDVFLDFLLQKDLPKEEVIDEVLTYLVASLHTSGYFLTWTIYFLATHKDIEEKLYQEINNICGKSLPVTLEDISKMNYLNQVIKESLRISVLAPYAVRHNDIDIELGGHIVPKETPVFHALGVVLQDEQYWPMPNKFDPDRFSPENTKTRPRLAFSPFGFAGQRNCPGEKFFNLEASIFLALIIRKFKLTLMGGQVVNPVYGLVTRPEDEVWITVEVRTS